MSTRHLLAILGFCCLATACGGGAGSGGGGTGATPTGEGPGQRLVPGFAIATELHSDLVAGGPCKVRVTVAPDAGQQAITTVEAWVGPNDYTTPGVTASATPVSNQDNTWDVSTSLPNPLPADATVWLRLTTADGSIIEVGRDAFQLATMPKG